MNKTFFQIYLSNSTDIPHAIQSCMEIVQSLKGDYQYRLFHNEQVRDFLKDAYPGNVLMAYDTLKPFAYKADLARLCLLATFGGWYFDSTIRLGSRLSNIDENINLVVFKDAPHPRTGSSWNVATGAIFARKDSPVLHSAISQIVKNLQNHFYG
jgi:mannosyltransferase OCH1-like enzyme